MSHRRLLLFGISCILLVLPTSSDVSGETCTANTTCCMVNRINALFNSTRFICCGGKLYQRDDPDKLYCCGQDLYSPATSICCENVLTDFNKTFLRPNCCSRVGYDEANFVCCQGMVRKRTFDNPGCCGKQQLDVTKQICCQDKIQSSSEGKISCCGTKSYNPYKDTCCKTTLYKNTITKTCCGSHLFDASLSTCCKNRLTHKPRLSCCDAKAYNQTTHLCCGKRVKKLENNNSKCCCNGYSCMLYDKKEKFCCNGKAFSRRSHLACCGKDIYDVRLQACCGTLPLGTSTKWRCCGGKPYDEDAQICCRNDIQPKKGRRTRCCGNKAYEPRRFQCEDYLFSRLARIKGNYCGERLYDVKRQLCCNKTILPKLHALRSKCCGKTVYNTRSRICCDGRLSPLPSGLPQCCYSRPFNILKQQCDVVTGDVISRSRPNVKYCGSKMTEYDSKIFICCQGKVKRSNGKAVKCCTDKPFNDSLLCCHGNLFSKHFATNCCREIGYNSSTHACCQGKLHTAGYTCCKGVVHPTPGTGLGQGLCCGSIGYNNHSQVCCNGMIFPKKNKTVRCCGRRPFDPSHNLQICCNESLSVSRHGEKSCCGKVSFNPKEDSCCSGRVYRRQKHLCCGENIHNTNKEVCCEQNVYPRDKYGNKCCKELAFDNTTHVCRGGQVMTKNLCEGKNYDDVTWTCCKGKLHLKTNNHECCNSSYFDTRHFLCCGDQVYPKATICCNGREYGKEFGCCGGEVFKIKSSVKCCHGKVYNKRISRCKKKQIVLKKRMKKKLCEERNNIAFVGNVSSADNRRHSLVVLQVYKGSHLAQPGDNITIRNKDLLHRDVVLQKGKVYFVIARLTSKPRDIIKHAKVYHSWDTKFHAQIQAILKKCDGNVYSNTNSNVYLLRINKGLA